MFMEHYPIITVQPEWVRADEAMGSKDKFWVDRPGEEHQWLFKFSRKNVWGFAGEHWSEKIAAEVAGVLGIHHALVELAEWQGHPGALIQKFPALDDPGTVLEHGNTLMPGLVLGYDPTKKYGQGDHTLLNVLRVLEQAFTDPLEKHIALVQFMGYLVLDALVMNTDRHHENWGLLRNTSATGIHSTRLAPTFDHASSLGRELTPEKLLAWSREQGTVARYVERGRAPIYRLPSDPKGLKLTELISLAQRLKPACLEPWLHRLHTFDPQLLVEIVHRVPRSMMGEPHRTFASALLRYTCNRLQQPLT